MNIEESYAPHGLFRILEDQSSGLPLEILHGRVEIEKQHFRKQHCTEDPSKGEHHQHMEIDRITTEKWRVNSGKWQRTA